MLSLLNQILLLFSLLLGSYSTLESNISDCALFTNQTNSIWKLVFEDQFDFAKDLNETWILQNELTECHGNNLKPVTNCNLPRNAFTTQSGYLVHMSKYERHLNYNFTGATLTSRAFFGYGRLEIRAIQPIGDYLRTRIITRNTEETTELKFGQLNLGSSIVDGNLYRDILTVDATQNADIQLDQLEPKVDLHGGFHLYGAEWNEEGVIFFFDDSYSKPIKYNVSTGLQPPHQIQLQMGVGGRDFDRPDAIDHFEDLDWQCPAFIIDYVRVYQRVANETLGDCLVNWATRNETEIADATLDHICDLALVGNEVPFSLYLGKYWRPITFGSLGLFLLCFIGYLIMLIIQMRRKLKSDPFSTLTNPADDEDGNTYETIIYDEPSALKHPNPENQYLKLYEGSNANNQYLQLSDIDEKYLKLYDLKVHEYLAITGSVDEISKKVPEYSTDHTKKLINNKLALMKKRSLSDGHIYLAVESEEYPKYLTMTPRKNKPPRNGLKNYEPLIV